MSSSSICIHLPHISLHLLHPSSRTINFFLESIKITIHTHHNLISASPVNIIVVTAEPQRSLGGDNNKLTPPCLSSRKVMQIDTRRCITVEVSDTRGRLQGGQGDTRSPGFWKLEIFLHFFKNRHLRKKLHLLTPWPPPWKIFPLENVYADTGGVLLHWGITLLRWISML